VPVLINQLIVREIRSLEHTEGFIAVVASERGSRSAGTSHKHSDYDVVFLFTYPRERYHSVLGHKETIRASRIQQGSLGMHDIELQGIELVTFARKVLRCDLSAIEVKQCVAIRSLWRRRNTWATGTLSCWEYAGS